jgi:hypothetical protein
MDVGREARHRTVGAAIALLLLAALVPCLVHMEGSEADDLCLSFGPLASLGSVPEPLPVGPSVPSLVAVYRVVPADLPVPPPKA